MRGPRPPLVGTAIADRPVLRWSNTLPKGQQNRLCVVGKREKEQQSAHAIQAQTPDIRRGLVEDAQPPHHHQTGPCCSDDHQRPHAVGCDKQHVNGTVLSCQTRFSVLLVPHVVQATRASSAPRKGTPRSGWTPTSIAEALCIRTGEVQVWQIGARGKDKRKGGQQGQQNEVNQRTALHCAGSYTFKHRAGLRPISARCKTSLTTVDQASVSTATAVTRRWFSTLIRQGAPGRAVAGPAPEGPPSHLTQTRSVYCRALEPELRSCTRRRWPRVSTCQDEGVAPRLTAVDKVGKQHGETGCKGSSSKTLWNGEALVKMLGPPPNLRS